MAPRQKIRMRRIHVVGLLLWRGGLVLAAAVALFEAARWLLRFADLPAQLEIGSGLVLAGLVLVLLSLVIERARDYRMEGHLRE